MNRPFVICIVFICALAGVAGVTFAQQSNPSYLTTADSTQERLGTFPARKGSVNDFENVLTRNEINELTSIIRKHKNATGNEIAVVTTKSFAPYPDLGSYAKDLATVWGIGKTKKDNGLMIMLSKKRGMVQLVPGNGLRGVLTDSVCNKILDDKMMHLLEREQYGEALIAGTREIVRLLQQ